MSPFQSGRKVSFPTDPIGFNTIVYTLDFKARRLIFILFYYILFFQKSKTIAKTFFHSLFFSLLLLEQGLLKNHNFLSFLLHQGSQLILHQIVQIFQKKFLSILIN